MRGQENKVNKLRGSLTEYIRKNKDLEHRKPFVIKRLKQLQTAKPGTDFSDTHSSFQREHDISPAPRDKAWFDTPKPMFTKTQLRKAAQSGPRATSKKVNDLQKQLTASETKHRTTRRKLEELNRVPETPQKDRSKIDLESLLEKYTHKHMIDSAAFGGIIHNIGKLLPHLRLTGVESRNFKLTDDDRDKLGDILQEMKNEIKTSQLFKILKILQVSTRHGNQFDQLKGQDTQELRNKQAIRQKHRDAKALHEQASGFQPGKGMLLKLLKASKKKRAPKAQSKPRQSSREPKQKEVLKHEPVGPFEL